ncbi:beta-lactamase family protein [Paenibacillus sp. SC116]|uniref:serine hydrolase domain-containing protein n=1 Tax=Paenibacillus sp. SC116 TaxID=2968986 RepID=UPI00215A60C1|nr:serine hydrolase domain-containing protein [Paenibacillus sp. SC116]MCR8842315.1 beta-lactamase family protein [Paenibacillus sp. SC116]
MNVKGKVMLSLAVMMAGTMLLDVYEGTRGAAIASAQAVSSAKASSVKETHPVAQKEKVKQLLNEMIAAGVPGVMMQSLKDGVKWDYAAGKASIHSGRPMKSNFHFRIASTTKTFTATVVLQLVGEGKLSLDDTVEKWLPGLVKGNGYDGSKITIKQLLNMTSGIANYTVNEKVRTDLYENRFKRYTSEELVNIALKEKPLFEPGTQWSYSNTNTVLAGLIIEKATGLTYGEQIKRRIIEPLKLKNTYVPGTSTSLPEPHARGYYEHKADGNLQDFTELSVTMGNAAGEMISTSTDLNRFFSELLAGKLLKPEQMEQMFGSPVDSEIGRYGLGIFETKLPDGSKIWGHGGTIHGYLTFVGGTMGGKHVINFNLNLLSNDMKKMNTVYELSDKIFAAEFAKPSK